MVVSGEVSGIYRILKPEVAQWFSGGLPSLHTPFTLSLVDVKVTWTMAQK